MAIVPVYDVAQTNAQRQPAIECPVPELQNIVSTAYLGQKLDLRNIALNCRNSKCNRNALLLLFHIRDPKLLLWYLIQKNGHYWSQIRGEIRNIS
jgi:TATA-box binding protein (TBP) (component of TFIID and TFIIIB)